MNGERNDPAAGPVVSSAALARIAGRLAAVGLNRCQATPVADLPSSVWLGGAVPQRPAAVPRETLLLVGHGGRALWRHLHQATDFDFDRTADPIDTFSVSET
ncbi:MAG: hypothetical protein OES24_13280, partial [Acidimicrobiia bacterium]|nr:hypothetical protein [Acidimicrobiia bacterium]